MPLVRCQEDPYLRSLSTRVLSCAPEGEAWVATLAETILYPEGGGQPADRGRVGEALVLDVQKGDGDAVLHRLDRPVEGEVEVTLDWPRRWDHMQQHTAQHLITALAKDRWGLATVAFHLGTEISWIDLDAAEVPAATVRELAEAVNREVRAGRPVGWRLVEPEDLPGLPVRSRGLPEGHTGPVRLVEIEGIDLNTCGGTHVASTAELQAVHLLPVEKAKGGSRLPYLAGDRVRRAFAACLEREAALKSLLTAGADELAAGVERLQAEAGELRRERKRLGEELAGHLGQALARDLEGAAHLRREGVDMGFLYALARAAEAARPGGLFLLTAPEAGNEGPFLLAGPPEAVKAAGPDVAALLGARSGGGPPGRYQGKGSRLDQAEEALALLRRRAGG